MSDGGVVITFGANDAEVQRVLQNMQKGYEKLIDQNKRLKEETTRANKEVKAQTTAISNQIDQLASMATGYFSLQAAASVVTRELENQVRLKEKMLDLQVTTSRAEANYFRNLGDVGSEEKAQLRRTIQNISRTTGVTQDVLYEAAGPASSAKGTLTNQDVLNALAMAARIAPDNPAELSATGAGLLDIASLTRNPNMSVNAGFMAMLGTQSRVQSLSQINANLVPGAKSVMGFGGTAEESAALLATMTSAMNDPTGSESRTASINLARNLAEFLPAENTYNYDAKGRPRLARKGTGLDENDERIAYMQEHPELLDQFMRSYSWEAQARNPSRLLLTKGTPEADLFQQNVQGYATDMATAGERYADSIRDSPLQKTADLARRGEAEAQFHELENQDAALRATARKTFQRWQESREANVFAQQFSSWGMSANEMVGGNPAEYALRYIQSVNKPGALVSANPEEVSRNEATVALLKSIDETLKANAAARAKNIDAHTE